MESGILWRIINWFPIVLLGLLVVGAILIVLGKVPRGSIIWNLQHMVTRDDEENKNGKRKNKK